MRILKPLPGTLMMPKRNLVGCWPMTARKGTTVYDLSGNRNTGTFNGNPLWVPSGVIDFDGDDAIDCGDTGVVSYPFTLAGWARADTITGGHVILSIVDANLGDQQIRLEFWNDAGTNKLALFWYTGPPARILESTTILVVGRWYFAAAVLVSNTEKYLYLNGVLEDTQLNNYVVPAGLDRTSIGRALDISPSAGFDGLIDIPLFFDRGLFGSEIAELYRETFYMFPENRCFAVA